MKCTLEVHISIADAKSGEVLHADCQLRRLASGEFRSIGSFETCAGIINITLQSSAAQRAVVDGTVRIEPLRQVRSFDEYQRKLLLQEAIASRRTQQRARAREASECAAREQRLQTTLLELQQAVDIAKQARRRACGSRRVAHGAMKPHHPSPARLPSRS